MEFVKMRKGLHQSTPPAPIVPAAAGKVSLVPTSQGARGQVAVKAPEPVMENDITYKKIIEDKPPKSEVLQYFRDRIEELSQEKDL